MPPKSSSKKVNQVSWYSCEKCRVHITYKQREVHDKHCPIIAEDDKYEYIQDDILYIVGVEQRNFTISELSEYPSKWLNRLIFISEGAMRLAHIHIGQNVVIESQKESNDHAPLVRSVWPIPEKFLSTVFVSNDDYNLNWSVFKDARLKITALSHYTQNIAKSVYLEVEQPNSAQSVLTERQLKDLERLVAIDIRHTILTKASRIYFDFFNTPLWLRVSRIIALETKEKDEQLTEALASLSIGNTMPRSFSKMVNSTKYIVERQNDDNKEDGITDVRYLIKDNIGGLDEQLSIIEDALNFAMGFQKVPKGVKVSRGILLHGPSGCGKTLICNALKQQLQHKSSKNRGKVITINTADLLSRFLGESEKNLTSRFEQAFSNYPQPTLIIVEDLHNLCPKHESNDVLKRISGTFANLLDSLSHRLDAQYIFVLATTSNIDALNPTVRRCGRLDCEVEIGTPTPKGRIAIIHCLLRHIEDHTVNIDEIHNIAQITHGYVGADLANLVYTAALAANKSAHPLTATDLHSSLVRVKPSAMREVLIESPNVRWSDIGGQDELKLKLQQAIEWPLLHPEKFIQLGIKPPRGILMYGPPGCSKTMVAKALATESQLNFLSIKGPELFSMWVGESERAVREVFRKARQVAPAIVFFDEIDAIGGERSEGGAGGSGSSVKERVLTQLLTELDGVETLENVTIVAATNRPDMIDPALLRPGRIDRIVYVQLPDESARLQILRIKLKLVPLASDVDIEDLVKRTDGYSGAELQALCHEAALKTLEEDFELQHVSWRHFEYALKAVQPRTSKDLLRLYEEYQKKS